MKYLLIFILSFFALNANAQINVVFNKELDTVIVDLPKLTVTANFNAFNTELANLNKRIQQLEGSNDVQSETIGNLIKEVTYIRKIDSMKFAVLERRINTLQTFIRDSIAFIIDDPVGETIDKDVLNFLEISKIKDTIQINALNYLVTNLKTEGIWVEIDAIYPIIGGTADSHKLNLKDPRDLDEAFRLTFTGNFTHDSSGMINVNAFAYADTHLIPSSELLLNDSHLMVYSKTSGSDEGSVMGTANSNYSDGAYIQINFLNDSYFALNSSGIKVNTPVGNGLGTYLISRLSSTQFKYFNDEVGILSVNDNSTGLSNHSIRICGANWNGNATFGSYRKIAFSSIGKGLTDLQIEVYAEIINNYQTMLERN